MQHVQLEARDAVETIRFKNEREAVLVEEAREAVRKAAEERLEVQYREAEEATRRSELERAARMKEETRQAIIETGRKMQNQAKSMFV